MLSLKNFFGFGVDSKKLVKKNFRKIMHNLSLEERFSKIYEIDYWGNATKSGAGSTLDSTDNLRKELPVLFEKFKINTVFDGPCGDFNWMHLVLDRSNIRYVGGDIVGKLIETNRLKFGNQNISFIKVDLTNDPLPKADLMICRDCLFHLSFKDTLKVLENYLKADIPWLFTTTYENTNKFQNTDIESGHFRLIDLFSEPYFFPKDYHFIVEDYLPDGNPRFMMLWSKEQVATAVSKMKKSAIFG